MNISISTANLYFAPFEKTLEIYKKAGYEYIELAAYWRGGEWEIAQHLKDVKPRDVVRLVAQSGLKISTFHDMGGIIEDGHESIVSRSTHEYLEYCDFPCLVFHVPHKKDADAHWWEGYKNKAISDLRQLKGDRIICLENLCGFHEDYYMPMLTPDEMLRFADEADIFVNLDTTHYAQGNIDILSAADTLRPKIKTVHLSDYAEGRKHVFLGEGCLDFKSFIERINVNQLHATTVECAIPYEAGDETVAVEKAKNAKVFVERLFDSACTGENIF